MAGDTLAHGVGLDGPQRDGVAEAVHARREVARADAERGADLDHAPRPQVPDELVEHAAVLLRQAHRHATLVDGLILGMPAIGGMYDLPAVLLRDPRAMLGDEVEQRRIQRRGGGELGGDPLVRDCCARFVYDDLPTGRRSQQATGEHRGVARMGDEAERMRQLQSAGRRGPGSRPCIGHDNGSKALRGCNEISHGCRGRGLPRAPHRLLTGLTPGNNAFLSSGASCEGACMEIRVLPTRPRVR